MAADAAGALQMGLLLRHTERGTYRANRISGHASGNIVMLDQSSALLVANHISRGRAGGVLVRGSRSGVPGLEASGDCGPQDW